MRDHERLAVQRTRLRLASTERTSARSSGTTLIQEISPPLTRPSGEFVLAEALPGMPLIAEASRNDSIQETPKRHIRSESTSQRWSLMSNDVPPPELRGFRRRSLGLKDFMKKMVKKDAKAESTLDSVPNEAQLTRAALTAEDKNAPLRPNTAAPKMISEDPFTESSMALPAAVRPENVRVNSPRYYAAQDVNVDTRPQTATGEMKASKGSRLSWGATYVLGINTLEHDHDKTNAA
jgi:hypothetical protein